MRSITDRFTPAVKTVVIADVAIYLFYVLVRQSRGFMQTHLALGPRFFLGELWQPVTSLFVHLDFLGFLLGMIGLWYIGGFIERTRGSQRCFALFVAAGVLANIAIAGVYLLMHVNPVWYDDGATFGVVALFVAFGRLFGRERAQLMLTNLTVQARYLTIIVVVWFALASIARGNWPALAGLFVATAVGYLGAAPGGMSSLRLAFDQMRDRMKARRLRRRFGVLEGGGRRSKKYVN
jgi:membrane associated rhomboid family serine protease